MPWEKDQNGEDKFVESIFDKSDLPTWDEIYNQFLINGVYSYSTKNVAHNLPGKPADSQPLSILNTVDSYWGIPHRKFLVAAVCNQLNKLVFEDGKRVTSVPDMDDIMFIISDKQVDKMISKDMDAKERVCPPIIRMRREGKMPIRMAQEYDHIYIDELEDLELMIMTRPNKESNYQYIGPDHVKEFWSIIEELFYDVITYFTNSVGWKGENGEVIGTQPLEHPGCVGSGADPAL